MSHMSAPCCYAGTTPETTAEIHRLQKLAAALRETNVAGADVKPADTDASGQLLEMLWRWRRQRVAAVQQEIARLQQALEIGSM